MAAVQLGQPWTRRTAAVTLPERTRHEVHLVEMTMLEEHNYSAILGYLHAVIRTDPALDAALDVHKHIEPTADTLVEAGYRRVLQSMHDPSVVAFTVYFWNRPQAVELARRVKERFPRCLIVFGGNDVTNQQHALFEQAPWTDVLVHGEGELRFREVLHAALLDDGELADIGGISYRDVDGQVATTPDGGRIVDLDDVPSPILTDVYSDEALAHTRLIIYETNRGCPYSCAFCFWGGATKSKVRQFSLERIEAELDRIVRLARPGTSLFVADANFGILGRDLQIAEMFVRLCQKYGKQLTFMTNWAKNSSSKVVEIATVLHRHRMAGAITLSAQSFDQQTLDIAHRSNIKLDRYRKLQVEFRERGIPTYTDLIWGLPGEPLPVHLDGVEEVLQAGGCPVVYPLVLLNNTEYASDTFGKLHPLTARHMPCDISDPSLVADVVVGHPQMSFDDWVRGMRMFAATSLWVKAAMRCTLLYLSAISGVRIVDMVSTLMDRTDQVGLASCPELSAVQRHHEQSLRHPFSIDYQPIDAILGDRKSVLEELHYQAEMYLVMDDAERHRAILKEATQLLVDTFDLAGTDGIGDLPGLHSLDVVGGTMWRAGNSTRPLTGMFAVSGRALNILRDFAVLPEWDYDPSAPVVSGRSTARPDRVGYWNTAYAMSLLRGARRLHFDADTRIIFGRAEAVA